MTKIGFISSLLILASILFIACENELLLPSNNNTVDLSGTWQSSGANIAYAFTDSISNIQLNFTDSLYNIEQINTAGDTLFYSGYFSTDTLVNSLFPITFFQTTPQTLTYSGIGKLERVIIPNELTLEIQASLPNIELNSILPAINGGFGSSFEGNEGADFIQRYVKIE